MRRWLIALFAFHFLLGVIGFGLPDTVTDTPVSGLASSSFDTPAPSQKGLADLDHALADELPDLPDTLQQPAAPTLAHVLFPLQPRISLADLPLPVLDAPFRPPRGA
jgi:hypothetical protein